MSQADRPTAARGWPRTIQNALILLLRDMQDKAVEPLIKHDLARQPALCIRTLGKLEQVGLHAITGKASDPVYPC